MCLCITSLRLLHPAFCASHILSWTYARVLGEAKYPRPRSPRLKELSYEERNQTIASAALRQSSWLVEGKGKCVGRSCKRWVRAAGDNTKVTTPRKPCFEPQRPVAMGRQCRNARVNRVVWSRSGKYLLVLSLGTAWRCTRGAICRACVGTSSSLRRGPFSARQRRNHLTTFCFCLSISCVVCEIAKSGVTRMILQTSVWNVLDAFAGKWTCQCKRLAKFYVREKWLLSVGIKLA